MTIGLTIFKSKFDNKTNKRMDFESFDEFEALLYSLAKREYWSKEKAPLISPAVYATEESDHPTKVKDKTNKFYPRRNANVLCWKGWAALDIDDWHPDGDFRSELARNLSVYRYVCYSTASSTHAHHKFRLVFPLTKSVPHDRIKKFWYALSTEIGLGSDPQTKDLSRMYYVPGNYHGISDDPCQFIFSSEPESPNLPIDVDYLIKKHPLPEREGSNFFERLPPEIQQEIINHRKGQMDNLNVSWSSIHNCPFWPKKLDQEYRTITETGWYHKLYQIMVAVAGKAIDKKYPITPLEIAQLCRELDSETGGWYKDRPLEEEAERAIEFVYRGGI